MQGTRDDDNPPHIYIQSVTSAMSGTYLSDSTCFRSEYLPICWLIGRVMYHFFILSVEYTYNRKHLIL